MIDQTQRGLLVPAWMIAGDGRRLAVAVISEDGGEWAGLTVKEAADRAGVGVETAKEHLETGHLPGERPRAQQSGPRSPKAVAWRQQHLPREMWAIPESAVAEQLGIAVSRLRYCVKKGLAPREERRRRGARSKSAVRWAERFVPGRLRAAPIGEIAAHYGVSASTLHAWVRRGVAPKVGGYRHGKRPASGKQEKKRAVRQLAGHLSKARRNPLAFAMGAT